MTGITANTTEKIKCPECQKEVDAYVVIEKFGFRRLKCPHCDKVLRKDLETGDITIAGIPL
jgi:endogenous inhibitor of DNA gyrase (YacG/DUF329 family)